VEWEGVVIVGPARLGFERKTGFFFFFEKQEFESSSKFVDRGMEDIGRTSYTNVKTKRNKNAK
jgi:hypothetical protein